MLQKRAMAMLQSGSSRTATKQRAALSLSTLLPSLTIFTSSRPSNQACVARACLGQYGLVTLSTATATATIL